MIPVFFAPYEDEALFSWIIRLSTENGMKVPFFYDTFFSRKSYTSSAGLNRHPYPCGFNHIACWYANQDFPDALQLLKHATTDFVMAPFRQPQQVFRQMQWFLDGSGTPCFQNATRLYFCPACMEEDVRQGRDRYFRTYHQLPSVTMCTKHKIPLRGISCPPGYWTRIFETENISIGKHRHNIFICDKPLPGVDEDTRFMVSTFFYEWYLRQPEIPVDSFYETVLFRIKNQYSATDKDDVSMIRNIPGFHNSGTRAIQDLLRKHFQPEQMMLLTALAFKEYKVYEELIYNTHDEQDKHPFSEDIYTVQCTECGYQYYVVSAFMNYPSIICPKCYSFKKSIIK